MVDPANIIITGAGSGLGRALAVEYASAGVTLGLIGRNRERLAETERLCTLQGARVQIAVIDVREPEKLQQWLQQFDDRFPVDLLIANAGVMHTPVRGRYIEDPLLIREILEINFFGVIHTVNPLLEKMRQRGKGRVAVISSLSAYRGIPAFPAYSAGKAAIKIYYDSLRGRYAAEGVFISVVCPSYIRTPMTDSMGLDPWMVTGVDRAARLIRHGIQARRALIAFPWYHRFGLWLLDLLPVRFADRLLQTFFAR